MQNSINNSKTNQPFKIGNASIETSQAGCVFSTEGIFPTICACTHGYAIGYVLSTPSLSKKHNIINSIAIKRNQN